MSKVDKFYYVYAGRCLDVVGNLMHTYEPVDADFVMEHGRLPLLSSEPLEHRSGHLKFVIGDIVVGSTDGWMVIGEIDGETREYLTLKSEVDEWLHRTDVGHHHADVIMAIRSLREVMQTTKCHLKAQMMAFIMSKVANYKSNG